MHTKKTQMFLSFHGLQRNKFASNKTPRNGSPSKSTRAGETIGDGEKQIIQIEETALSAGRAKLIKNNSFCISYVFLLNHH